MSQSGNNNPFMSGDGKKPSCMEMLQLIIDGEANEFQEEYFAQHMDGCMPCYKSYEIDTTIKQMIKSKCCGGQVPLSLVDEIKSKLKIK